MTEMIKWKCPSLTTPPPSKAAKVAAANPGLMLMSSRWWWSFLSIPVAESLAGLKGKEFILQISWFKPKIKPSWRNILTCQCFVWKQCEIPSTCHIWLQAEACPALGDVHPGKSSWEERPWGMAEEWLFLCGICRGWSSWGTHSGASPVKSCFVLISLYLAKPGICPVCWRGMLDAPGTAGQGYCVCNNGRGWCQRGFLSPLFILYLCR